MIETYDISLDEQADLLRADLSFHVHHESELS